jgi:pimeloyl-ACP methyl ester carboxylesterase
MRFIYLHGFASSPASRKARLFVEKLRQRDISLNALDLAPDFEHLSLSGQLAVIDAAVDGHPAVLIGSSLGGYLAAIYAAQHPAVQRLVLLAPAFDFYELWKRELGFQKLKEWRENGVIPVYHYGSGREISLGYQLMLDAEQFPAFPDFQQPCLILHGLKDAVVPYEQSAQFAAGHPNVRLFSFDSGHELTDVMDELWSTCSAFLLAANASGQ